MVTINTLLIIGFVTYCVYCYVSYIKRSNQIIMVDFDSIIADSEAIIKRGEIFIKNNPDKTMCEYLDYHLSELIPIPEGINKAWKLQNMYYKMIYITGISESHRRYIVSFLDKWNLCGTLCMSEFDAFDEHSKSINKIWWIAKLREHNKNIVGLFDDSNGSKSITASFSSIKHIRTDN